MTTDDPVLAALSRANPEPTPHTASGAELDRMVERILAEPQTGSGATRRTRDPRPRPGARALVPAVSIAVVVALVAVLVAVGGHRSRVTPGAGEGIRIVYRLSPTPQVPTLTPVAVQQELKVLQARAGAAGTEKLRVKRIGRDEIVITLAPGSDVPLAERLLGTGPQLEFYDWEASVLTPRGTTAAAGLLPSSEAAVTLSQGGANGPGTAGARTGAMRLYDAVRLASRQAPARLGPQLSRLGPVYYRFSAPRTASCQDATPCLSAGPVSQRSQLPAAGRRARTLTVPQGTTVVQASLQNVPAGSPQARFFVLRDRVAIDGAGATDATAGRDPATGQPDVEFRLNSAQILALRQLTRTLSHRGESVSLGQTLLDQHLAIVLDGRLLTAPQINFQQFPDGLVTEASKPFSIEGGLTARGASALADRLALIGPLNLQLVSPKGPAAGYLAKRP
jgi:SecD/SecF fusion protein